MRKRYEETLPIGIGHPSRYMLISASIIS
jgi:hypothetical protein